MIIANSSLKKWKSNDYLTARHAFKPAEFIDNRTVGIIFSITEAGDLGL